MDREMGGYLRTEDVRALLRLVGECREILDAGERPSQHFLHGIARLTRSQIAIQMSAVGIAAGSRPVFVDVHDIGWGTGSDRERVYGYVTSTPIDADPFTAALLRTPGPQVTLTRRDAMSEHAWARAEVRNDVHRPSGIDDSLLSLARTPKKGEVRVIALKRAWNEPSYGDVEREILDLAHTECGGLIEAPPQKHAALAGAWSPREKETLDLLLTGASEKSVAATLGLSPHTVHDYVKAIYKRVGVASRAELMARAIAKTGTGR
jgi:DNA-binding CsgD family transcriptional regulator